MHRIVVVSLCLILGVGQAQVVYGPGPSGPDANARLTTLGRAYVGNLGFGLRFSGGLPGSVAYVGWSTVARETPFAGALIQIGLPEVQYFQPLLLDSSGAAILPLPLSMPPSAALSRIDLLTQAVALHPFIVNAAKATRPLKINLGLRPRVFAYAPPLPLGTASPSCHLIDAVTGIVSWSGDIAGAMNVTDGAQAAGGADIFLMVEDALGWIVVHGDLSVSPPQFTPLPLTRSATAASMLYDADDRLIYVLSGATITPVGADPTGVGFGVPLAAVASPFLAGESVAISAFGNRIASVTTFTSIAQPTAIARMVDADASSATWLQPLASQVVPQTASVFFATSFLRLSLAPSGNAAFIEIKNSGATQNPDAVLAFSTSGIGTVLASPTLRYSSLAVSDDETFGVALEHSPTAFLPSLVRLDFSTSGIYGAPAITSLTAAAPVFPTSTMRYWVIDHETVFASELSFDLFTSTTASKFAILDARTGAPLVASQTLGGVGILVGP